MGVFTRPILLSGTIAILATTVVWLVAMPDDPERAVDDGLIAAAIASVVVVRKVRRDLGQG